MILSLTTVSAFAGLVTGCPSPSATPTATESSSANRLPVTVRLAFFPNVTHAAALYGTGSGIFAKAFGSETKLEERVFTAGPAEIEALFAGEVDLGYIGPGPALNGYLKSGGKALKIIAGASSGGAALVARPDSGINALKDLAGKRVAVPQTGGTQDISLRHALKTAGLKTRDKGGDVDVVQYAPADTLNQFRQKAIDAAWVPEPWVARLETEAGAKIVLEEAALWPDGKFSTAVVVARTEFLEKNPMLVAAFLDAHIAAVEAIQKDPENARRVIGERIKSLSSGKAIPETILKTALERTEITYDALPESVRTFADWSKELGYQREDRSALTTLFAEEPLKAALAKGRTQ
jgi:NitT/TauT family transport system substrate-binding protein